MQELLLLSHGQATVERGFSVERQVERHNLTEEESTVSQRLICDYVRSTGGVANVEVTKEYLISVKAARQRYQAFLDDQRKSEQQERSKKRQHEAAEVMASLANKKAKLKSEISSLTVEADELAEKAEDKGSLMLVTKSDALRRAAKEKAEELKKTCELLHSPFESHK